jgi:hypothetical protein
MSIPYSIIHQDGLKTIESLLVIPEPDLHPVLISRYMLQLAIFLQHLHPDIHKLIKKLSESPRVIMGRLADLATNLITTNDELIGSIEGLECVMLETIYQANSGNLRRSWLVGRRAIGIAQLMGFNRSDHRVQYKVLDPETKYHTQTMWFRILFLDRHLSLMLGLPQGSLDRSMASGATFENDTPLGRLERIHCVIASRILEHKECKPSSHDLVLTRSLDAELQRAARSLPSKWWLIPNLGVDSDDSEALFWDTRRLHAQVYHYNILNQLHLPYMLCSFSAERKYEYSRITCVNASREMLSRFIALRKVNRVAYCCRSIDFLALMAAMTLLLAHLDSHRSSEAENLLAHQYSSDRAMIEQAQEHMTEINRINSDALSSQSGNLLRRLLAIEIGTVGDCSPLSERVSVQGTESLLPDQDNDVAVSVHIPYFGIIKIAREGVSKEPPKPQVATMNSRVWQSQVADRASTTSTDTLHTESVIHPTKIVGSDVSLNAGVMTQVDASYGHIETSQMMPHAKPDTYAKMQARLVELSMPSTTRSDLPELYSPQLEDGLSYPLLHHEEYPGLMAGGEDWAFQGVDMAFFDSLIGSAGDEDNENVDWTM